MPPQSEMQPSNVELAVLNNTRWYEGMFAAHGLAWKVDGRVWLSHETPPAFHSNLVVLAAATTQFEVEAYVHEIERIPRAAGWSIKDSYACLDLVPLGFTPLFDAEWIWRDAGQAEPRSAPHSLAWSRVTTAAELQAWEGAWWGDARNDAAPQRAQQFPYSLLASADHAFFAGWLDGRIIAGGIANRSPGVVGISNLFSPAAFAQEAWAALVACIGAAFPNMPLVGYERGADLQLARRAGFEPIGKLCVWQRAA